MTPHKPVLRLDKETIRAMGAASLEKLLERIGPVTRGAGGGEPVILLNGRRIASQDEIGSLPPEAIEQMDILPEPVAAQFGYPANARVLNIITAARFTALQTDAALTVPTGGPGRETKASGSGTLLRGDMRSLASVEWKSKARIDDDAGQGFADTLQPAEQALTASGSVAGPLGKSLNASLALNLEMGWQARYATVADPESNAAAPDIATDVLRSRTSTAQATAMVEGFWGDWSWNSKLIAGSARSRQDMPGPARIARPASRGRNFNGNIALQATGPVVTLPAGSAFATVSIGAWSESARSADSPGLPDMRLRRRKANAGLSLSAPLTSPEAMALTINASADASAVSAQGRLAGWTAGMTANPLPGVSVSVNHSRQATPPTVAQASAPIVVVPDTLYFDRVTGRTVIVDQIGGGNPDLRHETQERLDLGVELQPFTEAELRVSATYSIASTRGKIASIDASDPVLEAAFPALYRRDPAGTLLSVSSIPINLLSSRQQSLKWTLSYSGDLNASGAASEDGPGAMPATPLFAFIHIDGEFRLEEVVRLAPGLPPLDLLNGAALDGVGGRPKFELLALASIASSNFGIDLNAKWQSSTRQPSGEAASDLRFSSLLTVGASTYVSLEALSAAAWARALRVELAANNLFGARQRIRDRDGRTPISLTPVRIDPRGRTVTLSLRKLF